MYRSKDMIEKAFGNLKERLNMQRTSVSFDKKLDGKLFVQFIALIYLFYIKKAKSDHESFKNYMLQEFVFQPQARHTYFDPPTPKREVLSALAALAAGKTDSELIRYSNLY